MKKLTTQEFILKANQVHNNKYDYSKTKYIKSSKKVIIICKKHKEFLQEANSHLKGNGCLKCNKSKKWTIDKFIKLANKTHNNKYNYLKVNYINPKTKITIICPKHGEFLQTPINHLKHGCFHCGNDNRTFTTKQFIKKAKQVHGNKYDYSKIKYINSYTKITIICPKHGEFLQTPIYHLNSNGNCPKCMSRISKNESNWIKFIEKQLGRNLKKNISIVIDSKIFFPDGFDPITNTIYEYNGYFWHGHPDHYNQDSINPITKTTFRELYQKTLEKEKLIKSAGYNLIIKWGK